MKRIISILITLLMIFNMLSVFAESKGPEKIYIFVKAGAENGDGSKDKPLGTFEEARDKIREIKQNGEYPEGGIVVYFREGTYQMTNGVTLENELDSGKEGAPIVYRSYMEEQVTFVGGTKLNVTDFSPVTDETILKRLNKDASGNILYVNLYDLGIKDLGELNYYGTGAGYLTDRYTGLAEHGIILPTEQPPEVFFDDVAGKVARYPNDDFTLTGKIIDTGDVLYMWSGDRRNYDDFVTEDQRTYPPKPSIFEVTEDVKKRMPNWAFEDDIWVYGFFQHNWADASLQVDKIDASKGVITTKIPSPQEIQEGKRYYIYNLLSELDSPGEYYIDRKNGNMYIYPTDMNGTVIFSSMKDPFVTMKNLDYVSLKALSFQGTLNYGLSLNGCANINIELCTISKTSDRGINANNVFDSRVTSNRVYQTGKGGIFFTSGGLRNDRMVNCVDNLISVNTVVENNEVSDYARIAATYSPAITPAGVGFIIRHNKMHGGDHMAGYFGSAETIWEYNEIYDVLRTSDDSGALYGGFGKSSRGVQVRNNYFHDIKSSSTVGVSFAVLYPDDTKDDITAEQNIFENIDGQIFYSNGGRLHTIRNNIVINANSFVQFNDYDTTMNGKYSIEQYDFLKYVNNPAYAKFRHFSDLTDDVENYLRAKYITVNNNVLIGVDKDNISGVMPVENDINPSLMLPEGTDPGFMNMAARNYILRDDSEIYESYPDFKAPDFKNMGMYTSMLKILMGDDTLAFLENSPKAFNGFTPLAITENHLVTPITKDGNLYLPVRFVSEKFGAKVGYDEETENVSITVGENTLNLTPSDYMSLNHSTMIEATRLAEFLGVEIKTFDNGITLVGKEIKITDEEDNKKFVNELERRLSNE